MRNGKVTMRPKNLNGNVINKPKSIIHLCLNLRAVSHSNAGQFDRPDVQLTNTLVDTKCDAGASIIGKSELSIVFSVLSVTLW